MTDAMSEKKLLTDLELKVMNILWDLKKGFVKEIIQKWKDEPVPAYNTVSTIVRILQEKNYVGHEAFGRSHQYFPAVSRAQYQKRLMNNVLNTVFSGSVSNLVSTLVDNRDLSPEEIDDLKADGVI